MSFNDVFSYYFSGLESDFNSWICFRCIPSNYPDSATQIITDPFPDPQPWQQSSQIAKFKQKARIGAEWLGGGLYPSELRIRIRIHVFLSLQDPDPDPLVRGMDPDPDPALDPDPESSIIMQK